MNSLDQNIRNITQAISNISTGQITFSIRETNLEGFEIKENDFLSIFEGVICVASKIIKDSVEVLIKKMIVQNEDIRVISVYYGNDVSQEDDSEVEKYVQENYSYLDIELFNGGQPLYNL